MELLPGETKYNVDAVTWGAILIVEDGTGKIKFASSSLQRFRGTTLSNLSGWLQRKGIVVTIKKMEENREC